MFQFQYTLSVADVINAVLLIVAITGVFLTYGQIRQSYKTQKATFFKELYSSMYGNSEIMEAWYKIEHVEFIYQTKFRDLQDEKLIDRLLSFVDLVCYLYFQKMITEYEMGFFRYRFTRIYENQYIQAYLKSLEGWYRKMSIDRKPYSSFVSYCERVLSK